MPQSSYLLHYAEHESRIAPVINGNWDYVLCIPAYKESAILLERLGQLQAGKRVLVLLLVNAPALASETDLELTRALLHQVQQLPVSQALSDSACLYSLSPTTDLLMLDRCTAGRLLPEGQGVGLARKILGDLAFALVAQGKILFPWIFCTDGDVQLPDAYFCAAQQQATAADAALIYPFRHQAHADRAVVAAQALYDFTLYYYVAGLTYAGSGYAFQSIGSTVAIAAAAYAKVRGFPRREAAEDFYMLNKLAKVGTVRSLTEPVIAIDSRYSDRVPFGTGAAIGKLTAMVRPLDEYRYYQPAVFCWLKTWLDALPGFHARQDPVISPACFLPASNVDLAALTALLTGMKAQDALAHALKHGKHLPGFSKQMHDWFDGFRTLKFLHAVRDHHYPSIPLHDPLFDHMLPASGNQALVDLHRSTLALAKQ